MRSIVVGDPPTTAEASRAGLTIDARNSDEQREEWWLVHVAASRSCGVHSPSLSGSTPSSVMERAVIDVHHRHITYERSAACAPGSTETVTRDTMMHHEVHVRHVQRTSPIRLLVRLARRRP